MLYIVILFLIGINCFDTFKPIISRKFNCKIYCNSDNNGIKLTLEILTNYNNAYLARNRKGREEGKTSKIVELERVQELKADGIKKEREQLRDATISIRKQSDEITLGIMADTGTRAIACLKAWVSGLDLPRGILRAVDENNDEVEVLYILK